MKQQKIDLFGDVQSENFDDDNLFRIISNLPLNWVGNKKRMLSRLLNFMIQHNVPNDVFFDVFAGSGVVSMLAATNCNKVVSNDLLMLSSTWLMHVLSHRKNPLSIDESISLVKCSHNFSNSASQLECLSELYGGALLTKNEVVFLDRYRKTVAEMFGPFMSVGQRIDGGLKPCYLNIKDGSYGFDIGDTPVENTTKVTFAMQMMCVHILQQAFMGGRCYKSQLLAVAEKRLKDGKVGKLNGNSNAIGNEDHLINLLSPKTFPTNMVCDLLAHKPFESVVTNCDAETLLASGTVQADVAYFDPPYGGYNSDYAWMYRVCEEFLSGRRLEDCEQLREASVKFKGDDYERDKSFAKKARKGYEENFAALLGQSSKFPHWLISFNESSFASIDDIVEIISSFRQNTVVEPVHGYRYNYRSNSTKNGSEYIILARN